MPYFTFWKRFDPTWLGIWIQVFALIAIFFEGYDQGVMGGVNASPRYVTEVGIGLPDGTVTDTVHQGGIVSIYYLGALFGCFAGGWLADRIGRLNGVFLSSIFALVGGALQAAATSSDFILIARVITGVGTGALTGIIPVYCAEVSTASHRGGFLGYVFIANYLGISVAYWLSFGLSFIDGGNSAIRWRFLLAFQCLPALLLMAGIKTLPESPRYLASVGRNEDALEVLRHMRGTKVSEQDIDKEFAEIVAACRDAVPASPVQFVKILAGKGKGSAHLGRRAWLCLWLQIMASWTGITAVTAYSPVLLSAAGYDTLTQNGLAGGLNTIGIVGTIISAQIVDRLGRRRCLMFGALGLAIVNILAGGLYEASRINPGKATTIAPAAVLMLFLFNLVYASTWGTVAFLIPTEIFPAEQRAQGNGFGIAGWAIGVGWTVLVNPIMFGVLENRTYFLFGGLNLMWIPIVYCFYPETANRSLESLYVLFETGPFNWQMEANYQARGDILRDIDQEKLTQQALEHSSAESVKA